jgi:hypothetical protein
MLLEQGQRGRGGFLRRQRIEHDPPGVGPQRIQMSVEQLADLVGDVRRGVLDEVVAAVG